MSITVLHALGLLLICGGALFFTAGTVGLIRFPDTRSRLHALTKADNVGLGLLLAGAALLIGEWRAAALLAVVWVLALASASVAARTLAALHADDGTAPTANAAHGAQHEHSPGLGSPALGSPALDSPGLDSPESRTPDLDAPGSGASHSGGGERS